MKKNKKKLKHSSKSKVQKWADDAHQYLIANHPRYAADVLAGNTVRWDAPKQLKDKDGNIIDTDWRINITDDCVDALDEPTKGLLE